jgi:hypothetical protein
LIGGIQFETTDFSNFSKDKAVTSRPNKEADQFFSKSLSDQSAAFLSTSFVKSSSDVSAKLAEESASWIKKSNPETKLPDNESVAEDDLLEDENLDQPVESDSQVIEMPVLPLIELQMINSVIPLAGPDVMGIMLKTSVENHYKELIKGMVAGTGNAVESPQGALSKAVKSGWSR